MDMTHEDLNSIGVTAFGHRHKIFKKIKEMSHTGGSTGTVRMEGGSGGKRGGGGGGGGVLATTSLLWCSLCCASPTCTCTSICIPFLCPPSLFSQLLISLLDTTEPLAVVIAQHRGSSTPLVELSPTDKDFIAVSEEVQMVASVFVFY